MPRGASRPATFVKLLFRFHVLGLIAGSVLTFAHTLGEFGVVLMVGGNLPGITRTVSISIYDEVQASELWLGGEDFLGAVVCVVCGSGITYALQRRIISPWPTNSGL